MQRTIIIGDVHGCFEELLDLLDRVGATSDDRLLSVGDLVDRGPGSVSVVAHFRSLPSAVVLMGNHERKHARGVFSYGQEITRLQFGDAYEDARSWMQRLPYFFEDEYVRVVHAAMVPGIPLAEQKEEILCGSTAGTHTLGPLVPRPPLARPLRRPKADRLRPSRRRQRSVRP
ncbi:MAG TPA: metallophosphoesterase family protein [Labilithrix sp.]|nr:metallophosphoesterase family protein [Labilithrix sp.]